MFDMHDCMVSANNLKGNCLNTLIKTSTVAYLNTKHAKKDYRLFIVFW